MSEQKNNNLWPASEHACIWMEAGIIDFKLCDRNYDCENCSFDAIMKNGNAVPHPKPASDSPAPARKPLTALQGLSWNTLNCYCENRYWFIEKLGPKKAVLGMNELAMHLLPFVRDLIMTEEGMIKKDQIICWFITHNGTLCLKSPFNGRIRKINIAASKDLKNQYSRLWLFIVESENLQQELLNFKTGDQAAEYLSRQRDETVHLIQAELQKSNADIGITMQDGGIIVDSLEQMLGSQKYFDLISPFFSGCKRLNDFNF